MIANSSARSGLALTSFEDRGGRRGRKHSAIQGEAVAATIRAFELGTQQGDEVWLKIAHVYGGVQPQGAGGRQCDRAPSGNRDALPMKIDGSLERRNGQEPVPIRRVCRAHHSLC